MVRYWKGNTIQDEHETDQIGWKNIPCATVIFEIVQQHLDPGIQFFALSFTDALRADPLRLPKLSRLELFTLRSARSP